MLGEQHLWFWFTDIIFTPHFGQTADLVCRLADQWAA